MRVIVLTGAGGEAFVSGADISEFKEKRATAEAAEAYAKISEARAPGAAKHPEADDRDDPRLLHRRRYGDRARLRHSHRRGGLEFGIPAAKLGLGYAYDGIKKLIDMVGPAFAREIFYTARQFTAEEALRWAWSIGLCPTTSSKPMSRTIATRSPATRR